MRMQLYSQNMNVHRKLQQYDARIICMDCLHGIDIKDTRSRSVLTKIQELQF